MTSVTVARLALECVQGDIAQQPDIDAIVNAANAQLLPGSGVAGAIHDAAGPGLAAECRPLAPVAPGEAVITGAHRLPNRFVIHCLGPVYGRDEPSDVFLASCYRNALKLADSHGVNAIAFPAISTGVFGYPIDAAAHVALDAVVAQATQLSSVSRVRFVLFSQPDLAVYEAAFAGLQHARRQE